MAKISFKAGMVKALIDAVGKPEDLLFSVKLESGRNDVHTLSLEFDVEVWQALKIKDILGEYTDQSVEDLSQSCYSISVEDQRQ